MTTDPRAVSAPAATPATALSSPATAPDEAAQPPDSVPAQSESGARTDFCRVTVATAERRVDLAIPAELPLAELRPDMLRLSGPHQPRHGPPGHHFTLRDGTVLDPLLSLAAQRVTDGEVLLLRPAAEFLAPPVFDDVSEAVAATVARDHTRWSDAHTRRAGLTGCTVLLVLLAPALGRSAPGRTVHGLPAILAGALCVLLLVLAGILARIYRDRGAATCFGIAALAHAAVAGAGVLPAAAGQGAGRLQFLTACAAVALTALVLVIVTPTGDGVFVAFLGAGTIGLVVIFPALLLAAPAVDSAAVCVPVSIGLLAFLPGLSARWARLPCGLEPLGAVPGPYDPDAEAPPPEPVDTARVAARSRRGHELLAGLVGACGAAVTAAAGVLAFDGDPWALVLSFAAGLALLTRARLFQYTAQVAVTLAAGLAVLTLSLIGLALTVPTSAGDAGPGGLHARVVWLTVAVVAGAALSAGIGLGAARQGATPLWGRLLEIVEGFLLLTLLPLCLAVLGVYHAIRAMTS